MKALFHRLTDLQNNFVNRLPDAGTEFKDDRAPEDMAEGVDLTLHEGLEGIALEVGATQALSDLEGMVTMSYREIKANPNSPAVIAAVLEALGIETGGAKTLDGLRSAVAKFQDSTNGALVVDGDSGPNTIAAMIPALEAKIAAAQAAEAQAANNLRSADAYLSFQEGRAAASAGGEGDAPSEQDDEFAEFMGEHADKARKDYEAATAAATLEPIAGLVEDFAIHGSNEEVKDMRVALENAVSELYAGVDSRILAHQMGQQIMTRIEDGLAAVVDARPVAKINLEETVAAIADVGSFENHTLSAIETAIDHNDASAIADIAGMIDNPVIAASLNRILAVKASEITARQQQFPGAVAFRAQQEEAAAQAALDLDNLPGNRLAAEAADRAFAAVNAEGIEAARAAARAEFEAIAAARRAIAEIENTVGEAAQAGADMAQADATREALHARLLDLGAAHGRADRAMASLDANEDGRVAASEAAKAEMVASRQAESAQAPIAGLDITEAAQELRAQLSDPAQERFANIDFGGFNINLNSKERGLIKRLTDAYNRSTVTTIPLALASSPVAKQHAANNLAILSNAIAQHEVSGSTRGVSVDNHGNELLEVANSLPTFEDFAVSRMPELPPAQVAALAGQLSPQGNQAVVNNLSARAQAAKGSGDSNSIAALRAALIEAGQDGLVAQLRQDTVEDIQSTEAAAAQAGRQQAAAAAARAEFGEAVQSVRGIPTEVPVGITNVVPTSANVADVEAAAEAEADQPTVLTVDGVILDLSKKIVVDPNKFDKGKNLNLRDRNGNEIGKIPKGTEITIAPDAEILTGEDLGFTGDMALKHNKTGFIRVTTPAGKTGFAAGAYLTSQG